MSLAESHQRGIEASSSELPSSIEPGESGAGSPIVSDDGPSKTNRKRGPVAALLVGLRPRQWTKNLLVFAPLLFTLDAKHNNGDILRATVAFLIFCLLSGASYLINDIVDVETDRAHPVKRFRPVAAGEISPTAAGIAAGLICAGALAEAFHLSVAFGVAASAYLVLTLAYSFRLKHVVLLDLLVLASGFVLRAVAGAWVINVRISEWLILCTLLLALFLGIAKRRAELIAVRDGRTTGRMVIEEYTAELLDQMSTIVTSALLMCYALYTIQSETAAKHPYLLATIPFVLYGIFRYLYLVHRKSLGESPDEVVLRDRPLIACICLWGLVTAVIITHRL